MFLFRCRNKIHKEHVDNNDPLAPCKLHHDPHSAREMLLLASTPDEQSSWVTRLSKRIQKCGYKANSSSNNNSTTTIGNDGSKISPRWELLHFSLKRIKVENVFEIEPTTTMFCQMCLELLNGNEFSYFM